MCKTEKQNDKPTNRTTNKRRGFLGVQYVNKSFRKSYGINSYLLLSLLSVNKDLYRICIWIMIVVRGNLSKNNLAMPVTAILNWHISTCILTRIVLFVLLEIPVDNIYFTMIAMTKLKHVKTNFPMCMNESHRDGN